MLVAAQTIGLCHVLRELYMVLIPVAKLTDNHSQDFVSHFSHLSQHFARRFIIHCNGVGIPPTGWADFIQEDNEQVIDIELLESYVSSCRDAFGD